MASETTTLRTDLDFSSHEQLYYQLYNIIFRQIVNGEFAIGDLVPPELELAKRFNVSRATVRKAMEMLVNDGLVERRRGIGTVVISNRPSSALNWVSSCLRRSVVEESGGEPAVKKVISSSIVLANEETAQALDVPVGTRLFRLDRLRCSGTHPFYRETAYLDESYVPHAIDHDFQKESLRAYYSSVLHVSWPRAVQNVRAGIADPETEQLLGIDPGTPVLMVSRISYDASGTPREYIKWNYRSDYYYFQISLEK
jgi:GntR family transcriptional regulator